MIAVTPNDPEWYTPQHILDRVYSVIGRPDLDPCCNRHGPANVAAKDYCRLPERDGLAEPWHGNIYLNPPYGRDIGKWIDKACAEYLAGNTRAMIALVPVKCDTQWWAKMAGTALCWCAIRGRLSFSAPGSDGGGRNTGTFASAAVLFAEDNAVFYRFLEVFGRIGDIWIPANLGYRQQFPREFYAGPGIHRTPGGIRP